MGRDNGGKSFQEQLQRAHGQNQGGEWKQGREVDLAGAGGVVGGKCRQL